METNIEVENKSEVDQLKVVYVGCGMSAIKGAINLDNSPSVFIGRHPVIYKILNLLGTLNDEQKNFINVVKELDIRYGAADKLPFKDHSVDVVYSSHTIEHLYEEDYIKFLKESERVLKPDGVFRMAIPDLGICVNKYIQTHDADHFCTTIHMGFKNKPSFVQKVSLFAFGDRKHKWMYDGNSMKEFILKKSNFQNVKILSPGETTISGFTGINYKEREDESVYLECRLK